MRNSRKWWRPLFLLLILTSLLPETFTPAYSVLPGKEGGHVGGGGDIRRFRAGWALDYIDRTLKLFKKADLPGCEDAAAILEDHRQDLFELSQFILRRKIEWTNRQDGSCLELAPNSGRLSFSYGICSRNLAPQQIVYLLLDLASTDLSGDTTLADLFVAFGNRMRNMSCKSEIYSSIRGEDLILPTDLDRRGILEQRILESQSRSLKQIAKLESIPPQDEGSWDELMQFAGLDPRQITLRRALDNISNWKIAPRSDLGQCAETEFVDRSPILLSVRNCGHLSHVEELRWVLLHETAHQMGVKDELLADRFAETFVDLGTFTTSHIRSRR